MAEQANYVFSSLIPNTHSDDDRHAGVSTGLGDEWLRVGGVKYGADGSASERTMRMSTRYVGRPDDYGILTMNQEEVHEAVEVAHRANWQVGIHAKGDVTIDIGPECVRACPGAVAEAEPETPY